MSLKNAFILAIGGGTLISTGAYTYEHTKQQVLYSCDGPSGHAELINPNRYGLGHDSVFIKMTKNDTYKNHYRVLSISDLRADIDRVCQTGRASSNLRLER